VILITGGLGFIGAHTARALLDLGQSCLLTRHHHRRVPDFLEHELGRRIVIEQVDCADTTAVLRLGDRHQITSIVHLAAPTATRDPIGYVDTTTCVLLNVLRAAKEWGVSRVSIASSIGLYIGVTQAPFREDLPLPMIADDPIPVLKKCGELLGGLVAHGEEFELINLRVSTIWGPLGPPDTPFFALPHLVHAAARGASPDLSQLRDPPYADDGADLCYVKNCGRAIALLSSTNKLHHHTYNIGDGRATSNGDIAVALERVLPEITIDLPPGRDPDGPGRDTYMDITRLQKDTGYQPKFSLEDGLADYLEWLSDGRDR
jgi:UDP-glucose 4-epimerase